MLKNKIYINKYLRGLPYNGCDFFAVLIDITQYSEYTRVREGNRVLRNLLYSPLSAEFSNLNFRTEREYKNNTLFQMKIESNPPLSHINVSYIHDKICNKYIIPV